MTNISFSGANSSLENHLPCLRFSSNEASTIWSALGAIKMDDSTGPLINVFNASTLSSMNDEQAVESKLAALACKIIAFKAKGGDCERVFSELEGVLTNLLNNTDKLDTDKIDTIRKHFSLLKSTINHSIQNSAVDQSIGKQWNPFLLEKGKTMAKETGEGVQKALDNFSQLKEILPGFSSETDLAPQFEKIKFAIEKDLKELNSLENQEHSFEKIIETLTRLNQQKQELKKLIVNVQAGINKWEAQLGDKIRFQVDHETDVSENYGNKHARLIEQAELLSKIQLPGIRVPIPHGISNSQIQSFLNIIAPQIHASWNDLATLHDDFIMKKGISSEFLKLPKVAEKLAAIHLAIEDAFEQAANKDDFFEKLVIPKEFLSWMEELKASNTYLMVRSSGAEDTRKTANAGGNVSVAYVNPERSDLCNALGKVVISYFSEGSLQNRLNAEENPFSSPLRLAVTTQELIGESVGGSTEAKDIPVSLVLFSNEPTYVGNEPFRLMRISATWGHGEAVVGAAGVKSDTILLLKSVKHPDRLYIVENNQAKPKRLAPKRDDETGEISLEKLDNPPELAGKPALDHTMLTRLFYLGVAVEKAYEGHPMDMEIVVKDGIIYPVQARPINRPSSDPTYFDWKKANALNTDMRFFEAEVVLPGVAQTQVIRLKEEILITDNLEKAEKLFKKEKHKLVIVREEEAANSHPVVNFSGMGIPVMYHEKREPVQNLVDQISENQVLIACVQSGNLVLWDTKIPVESAISPGYTVHPAKVAVSVTASQLPSSSGEVEVSQEIKNLTLKLRALDTNAAALETARGFKNQPALQELRTKRKILAKKIASTPHAPERAKILEKGLETLEIAITSATSELKATLKQGEQARLHPLFHGKVVETLFQQPEASGGLGQLSIVNAEAQLKDVEELFRYQENFKFPTFLHEEVLAASACATPEQKTQWVDFVTSVENAYHQGAISLKDIEQFKQMLAGVEKLNLLPLWMARFFLPEAAKMDQNASTTLSNLLKTVDPATEQHLNEMQGVLYEIQAAQDNVNLFADEATFQKGWKNLLSLHKKLAYLDGTLKQKLESLQPIGRIATYQVMTNFVDLYDSSIKSMKASLAFTRERKVELFDRMLGPNFDMLEGVTTQLSGPLLQYHQQWPLDKYLTQLKTQLDKSQNGVDQLDPSRGFNVSAGVLGAVTAFERSLPQTKEDVFTTIHQGLLFSLGALMGSEMKGQTQLPLLLQKAEEIVANMSDLPILEYFELHGEIKSNVAGSLVIPSLPIQLIGYEFSDNQIILKYNYPLRNHSGSFSIIFDIKTQSHFLDVKFVGPATGRFDFMGDVIQILNYFKEIEVIKKPKINEMELTYTLKLKDEQAMIRCFTELRQQAVQTMLEYDSYKITKIIEYIDKKNGENASLKCLKDPKMHFTSHLPSLYVGGKFQNEVNIAKKMDYFLLFCQLGLPDSLDGKMIRNELGDLSISDQNLKKLSSQEKERIRARTLEVARQPLADRKSLLEFLPEAEKNILDFSNTELQTLLFMPSVLNSFLGSASKVRTWAERVEQLLVKGGGLDEAKNLLDQKMLDPLTKRYLTRAIDGALENELTDPKIKEALEILLTS